MHPASTVCVNLEPWMKNIGEEEPSQHLMLNTTNFGVSASPLLKYEMMRKPTIGRIRITVFIEIY